MIEGLATRLAALSATQQPVSEGVGWHRADSAGQVLLYTLRQDGWRKGEPVMVNDLEVRVQAGNGASIDLEPIIAAIRSALPPAPNPIGEEKGAS